MNCLNDRNQAVRYAASTNLPYLLKDEAFFNLIKANLKIVIESHLRLITEVDSDEPVKSLHMLVDIYKSSISTFATDIALDLAKCFTDHAKLPK